MTLGEWLQQSEGNVPMPELSEGTKPGYIFDLGTFRAEIERSEAEALADGPVAARLVVCDKCGRQWESTERESVCWALIRERDDSRPKWQDRKQLNCMGAGQPVQVA